MIRLMTAHELVAVHSVQDAIHDGPLRRCDGPPARVFRIRKGNGGTTAQVSLQTAVLHKDSAPNNLARLADTFDRPAAEWEVHGRLTFAGSSRVAVHQMIGRNGARNLKQPNELLSTIDAERLPVAYIVERRFRIEPQAAPDTISNQSVQACAFVGFVEMRNCAVLEQHSSVAGGIHRWPVDIVEKAFRQV